jgi:hypothetical protein
MSKEEQKAMKKTLRCSRRQYGEERATMLAVELSQDKQAVQRAMEVSEQEQTIQRALEISEQEQAVQRALELSERVRRDRAAFESALDEVKRLSLQSHRSEEVWDLAQVEAQEECRRAYEDEIDRCDRLWERELLDATPSHRIAPHSETTSDEGYKSGSYTREPSTPQTRKVAQHNTAPQNLPTVQHGTWKEPTARVASSLATGFHRTSGNVTSQHIAGDIRSHYAQTPPTSASPPAVYNKYHHHGDIYHQTLRNYITDYKKHSCDSTPQSKRFQHSSAGVNGLYQRASRNLS